MGQAVAYDLNEADIQASEAAGAEGARTLHEVAAKLSQPRPAWVMGRHLQLQGVVNVDPSGITAKGRWQCLFMSVNDFNTPSVPTAYWGYGVYENEYIKENNKWLFKKMHFNRIFFTPFQDGWVKTPDIRPNSIELNPTKPDKPPTAYHPYPEEFIVPFHYKHPVTGK